MWPGGRYGQMDDCVNGATLALGVLARCFASVGAAWRSKRQILVQIAIAPLAVLTLILVYWRIVRGVRRKAFAL